jgi:hypothetical protein
MTAQRANAHWTPNQVVALNVARARVLRGWTQARAAEALAPYLGARLSQARSLIRERFGDLGEVRAVLRGLADLMHQLDQETANAAAPERTAWPHSNSANRRACP